MRSSSAFASIAIVAGLVSAHAGHDHTKEQAIRRDYLQHTKNDLSHCAAKIKARGLEARNLQRREQLARNLAEKRGISLLNCRWWTPLPMSSLWNMLLFQELLKTKKKTNTIYYISS